MSLEWRKIKFNKLINSVFFLNDYNSFSLTSYKQFIQHVKFTSTIFTMLLMTL